MPIDTLVYILYALYSSIPLMPARTSKSASRRFPMAIDIEKELAGIKAQLEERRGAKKKLSDEIRKGEGPADG